jgi:carbamoyl-phosphate synthase large subunit
MVSTTEAIESCLDKSQMYSKLSKTGIPLPKVKLAFTENEFYKAIDKLGYPENPVVFKPTIGKGSRGVRILDPKADRRDLLLNQKPNNKYMNLEDFTSILGGLEDVDFPKLIVMEHLEGQERTTDIIAKDGEMLVCSTKTMERAHWGTIVEGELVNDPDLLKQSKTIVEALNLSYCVNIQFIGGKLIEINPRVSTFIYQPNFIQPYVAVKLALGELTTEQVKEYQSQIWYGLRMIRYMEQAFYNFDWGEVY